MPHRPHTAHHLAHYSTDLGIKEATVANSRPSHWEVVPRKHDNAGKIGVPVVQRAAHVAQQGLVKFLL
jgi:hypothetical protein